MEEKQIRRLSRQVHGEMNKRGKIPKHSLACLIILLIGTSVTYLIDVNRYGRKRERKEKQYNVDLKTAQEDIQAMFGKVCRAGTKVASLLAVPDIPVQPDLLKTYIDQSRPCHLSLISGTKAISLTSPEKSKELTKEILFLVEKVNKTSERAVGMGEKSEKETYLYYIVPIGGRERMLLVELKAGSILEISCVKKFSAKYFIEISGPRKRGVLINNGAPANSRSTVETHVGLARILFTLKLTPKEKEEFPWDRIFTWGWGLTITFGLVSFLSILQKKNIVLEESKQVIEEDKRKLHELSIKDPLTDIYNRRHFEKLLHSEFRRAKRYSFQLSCIMLDIDHFKQINDTYGHQFGDEVLKEVSGLLKNLTRDVDIAARYGGEEFIAILPETDVEGALTLAERIRSKLAEKQYVCRGKKLTITASLGVSTMKPDSEDIADEQKLVFQADQALYQAKGAGRNRVYRFAIKEVKCASASC